MAGRFAVRTPRLVLLSEQPALLAQHLALITFVASSRDMNRLVDALISAALHQPRQIGRIQAARSTLQNR